jgi:hypothetical protein
VTGSGALHVGDQAFAVLDQLVRLDADDAVPRARRRSYLGPLQQVEVDEHTQVRRVTERRHAADGS